MDKNNKFKLDCTASGLGLRKLLSMDLHIWVSSNPKVFCLADAQLTIAREYGLESWPKLKAQVASLSNKKVESRPNLRSALRNLREG